MATMMNIIDITDFLVDRKRAKGLTKNQETILREVGFAHHCAKSAAQWPEGREAYFRHCRDHLEKVMVYLNEELDGEQDES